MQTNFTNTTPLRYLSRPFDYNYTTGSFSLNQMDTVPVQTSFEWQDYPCLYYDYFTFNATAGHEIRGHFSLSENGVGIQFFILNQGQLRNFGNCGNGKWNWELHAFASSYNFDWFVPETDVYAFMFFSRGFYGGSILITAQDYNVTRQTLTESYTSTATYTNQSNLFELSNLTNTTAQTSISDYYPALALIVIIALVVALVALRLRRRSQPNREI